VDREPFPVKVAVVREDGPGVAQDVQQRACGAAGPARRAYERARRRAKAVLGPQDNRGVLAQSDPQAAGESEASTRELTERQHDVAADEEPKRLLER
jgi:hypothetical protein